MQKMHRMRILKIITGIAVVLSLLTMSVMIFIPTGGYVNMLLAHLPDAVIIPMYFIIVTGTAFFVYISIKNKRRASAVMFGIFLLFTACVFPLFTYYDIMKPIFRLYLLAVVELCYVPLFIYTILKVD